LPNVRSPNISPNVNSIGEDEQDETYNSEAKEEDVEVVISKERRKGHK
jgi:hypothetical protein